MRLPRLFGDLWGTTSKPPTPSEANRSVPQQTNAEPTEPSAAANNRFAIDLYARLREREDNLFFSPFSISLALAMVYAGVRGETARQMTAALRFPADHISLHPRFAALVSALTSPHPGYAKLEKGLSLSQSYALEIANRLWGQEGCGFLEDFQQLLERHYGTRLKEVDFSRDRAAVAGEINRWVAEKTRGKIDAAISPESLTEITRLILVNAVYFHGKWAKQFEVAQTADEPFYLSDGNEIRVPLMRQAGFFLCAEFADYQVLQLSYRTSSLSMIIFLPREREGLARFEKSLTAETLQGWAKNASEEIVRLWLPRFRMDSNFRLSSILAAMGLPLAFTAGADFSGMNGGKEPLFLSEVIHKAYVDVDEEGTEAAAATIAVMTFGVAVTKRPPKLIIFRADHPFLFLIQDSRSHTTLFMGRVENPAAQS